MENSKTVKLVRDCSAMLIPSGTKVTLAEGVEVEITHCLGGNFTVKGNFGLARIDGIDVDAFESAPTLLADIYSAPAQPAVEPANNPELFSDIDENDLWEIAKTVYDPEVPVNIVDLGLVYKLEVVKNSDGKNCIEADITLTAPGCVMGPMIAEDLRLRLEALPSVFEAKVSIVWDPPWHQDMISEEARMILGLA